MYAVLKIKEDGDHNDYYAPIDPNCINIFGNQDDAERMARIMARSDPHTVFVVFKIVSEFHATVTVDRRIPEVE